MGVGSAYHHDAVVRVRSGATKDVVHEFTAVTFCPQLQHQASVGPPQRIVIDVDVVLAGANLQEPVTSEEIVPQRDVMGTPGYLEPA